MNWIRSNQEINLFQPLVYQNTVRKNKIAFVLDLLGSNFKKLRILTSYQKNISGKSFVWDKPLTLKRGHLKVRNITRQSRYKAMKAGEDSFSSAQHIFLISYRVASQSFSDKSDHDFAVGQQINLMPYPISRRGVVLVSS